jgi:hypothetical protein
VHASLPAKGNQLDFPHVSRFKADGRSGRDIQAHSPCRIAIKLQGIVHFVKMKVASNLNGAVTRMGHFDNGGGQAGIGQQPGWIYSRYNFSGDHCIGS